MEASGRDPHVWTYRVVLVVIAVAVPLAGVLAWSGPAFYDVFAVRVVLSVSALALLVGAETRAWVRERQRALTAVIATAMAAWFLWLGRQHGMTADDVVGLIPIMLICALLVRRTWELLAGTTAVGVGLALAYAGLPSPVFPGGIVTLLLLVVYLTGATMSVARARLEDRLTEANRDLEGRVRERTAALAASEAEARRASQAKSVFLANMSHELRTPLTAILGYVEIVQEDVADTLPDAVDDLGRVASSAQHLLGLIDDLLDLARIEAGRLELSSERVPVGEVVDGAVKLIASAARARNNELVVAVPEGAEVRADSGRLRQVLVNLLSNAAKFTEGGRIEVCAREDGADIRIEVRDTGIGMAPELIARAFDRFAQGDGSSTRRYGGSGLGLAICEELMRQMSGRIEVVSALGRGSTFTVVLPRA